MVDKEEESLHAPLELNEIPEGWVWARLEDACEGVYDCPHSTPTLTASGPFMVRTQDILTGTFRAEQAAHVSKETYRERVQRAEPRSGDLFYSREGTYFGIAAEVPPNQAVCLGQRMVLLRPDVQKLRSRFLRYWLNSPAMARRTEAFRDGSVAERLNLPTIRALPVLIPPVSVQEAIACILGALDDKIELNRKMNQTLEGIARAIFKSWFVDFDPVRAKSEGREPGLPAAMADLFPSSFVDSELGQIPEGWRTSPLTALVDLVGGGTPKTSESSYWNGQIPWFSVVDAPNPSDVWVVRTEKMITEEGLAHSSARVLPAGATILSARGTVGRVALVGVPMAMNQSCYGLRSKGSGLGFFTYFLVRQLVGRLQQNAHGSVFDTVTRDTLARLVVVAPPSRVICVFETRAEAALQKMRALLCESHTLAAIRDTLLPKLISGELRVPDAERIVGRCV